MSSVNNLVPLEFNPVLEGGAVTDYWWVGLILLVIVIVVVAILTSSDSDSDDSTTQSTSVKQSSSMQMGMRINDNGEKEYYKIVDGEEQPLSEEDIKNLKEAQKNAENVDEEVNKALSGLDGIIGSAASDAAVKAASDAAVSA